MSRINQHVTLPDGRVLGYDDYGPATGKPLFYFHGRPSSRLEWQMFGSEQLATALHLRVISMDRPGMGLSDFQPARRLGDWPTDAIALVDRLDIGRFAVPGYSGGGPYAAVCAFAIPQRQSHFYQEEGHLSLFANYLRDILAVFAADAPISV